MKHCFGLKVTFIISCILSVLAFQGCQKTPINGDLDGQWQVVEVSPLPEETVVHERLYYNFSLHVCQLTYYDGWFTKAWMEYNGETLSLDFPYIDSQEDLFLLRQYGVPEPQTTFKVKFERSNRLTLTCEQSTVTLVKL